MKKIMRAAQPPSHLWHDSQQLGYLLWGVSCTILKYGQGKPHLRAADIDVGKTVLVVGDGQVCGLLVIDAEKN